MSLNFPTFATHGNSVYATEHLIAAAEELFSPDKKRNSKEQSEYASRLAKPKKTNDKNLLNLKKSKSAAGNIGNSKYSDTKWNDVLFGDDEEEEGSKTGGYKPGEGLLKLMNGDSGKASGPFLFSSDPAEEATATVTTGKNNSNSKSKSKPLADPFGHESAFLQELRRALAEDEMSEAQRAQDRAGQLMRVKEMSKPRSRRQSKAFVFSEQSKKPKENAERAREIEKQGTEGVMINLALKKLNTSNSNKDDRNPSDSINIDNYMELNKKFYEKSLEEAEAWKEKERAINEERELKRAASKKRSAAAEVGDSQSRQTSKSTQGTRSNSKESSSSQGNSNKFNNQGSSSSGGPTSSEPSSNTAGGNPNTSEVTQQTVTPASRKSTHLQKQLYSGVKAQVDAENAAAAAALKLGPKNLSLQEDSENTNISDDILEASLMSANLAHAEEQSSLNGVINTASSASNPSISGLGPHGNRDINSGGKPRFLSEQEIEAGKWNHAMRLIQALEKKTRRSCSKSVGGSLTDDAGPGGGQQSTNISMNQGNQSSNQGPSEQMKNHLSTNSLILNSQIPIQPASTLAHQMEEIFWIMLLTCRQAGSNVSLRTRIQNLFLTTPGVRSVLIRRTKTNPDSYLDKDSAGRLSKHCPDIYKECVKVGNNHNYRLGSGNEEGDDLDETMDNSDIQSQHGTLVNGINSSNGILSEKEIYERELAGLSLEEAVTRVRDDLLSKEFVRTAVEQPGSSNEESATDATSGSAVNNSMTGAVTERSSASTNPPNLHAAQFKRRLSKVASRVDSGLNPNNSESTYKNVEAELEERIGLSSTSKRKGAGPGPGAGGLEEAGPGGSTFQPVYLRNGTQGVPPPPPEYCDSSAHQATREAAEAILRGGDLISSNSNSVDYDNANGPPLSTPAISKDSSNTPSLPSIVNVPMGPKQAVVGPASAIHDVTSSTAMNHPFNNPSGGGPTNGATNTTGNKHSTRGRPNNAQLHGPEAGPSNHNNSTTSNGPGSATGSQAPNTSKVSGPTSIPKLANLYGVVHKNAPKSLSLHNQSANFKGVVNSTNLNNYSKGPHYVQCQVPLQQFRTEVQQMLNSDHALTQALAKGGGVEGLIGNILK